MLTALLENFTFLLEYLDLINLSSKAQQAIKRAWALPGPPLQLSMPLLLRLNQS